MSDESAIALYERATLLHGEGRFDAALAALRDAIRRAEEDEDGHEPSWMYWARYREGLYLYKLGRSAEALVVCEAFIQRCEAEDELAARLAVNSAKWLRCLALDELSSLPAGHDKQAIVSLDELIDELRGCCEPELQERLALRLANKVIWLVDTELFADAIAVSDEILGLFDQQDDPKILAEIGDLLVSAAARITSERHAGRERYEQALKIYRVVTEGCRDSEDEALAIVKARAQYGTGDALWRLGRYVQGANAMSQLDEMGEAALVVFDDVLDHNARTKAPRSATCAAMVKKAAVLGKLGRDDEALALVERAIKQFRRDRSPLAQAAVAAGRATRSELRARRSEPGRDEP